MRSARQGVAGKLADRVMASIEALARLDVECRSDVVDRAVNHHRSR